MNVRSVSLWSLMLWMGLGSLAPASAQTVITDNLIVQAKECVGIDCVSSESFGFDVVKLKHNNTRLLFDDTSTTAGFPATDWRLTANDTFSGGVNRFSLEDVTAATVPVTVRGGAPSNSLFISNLGRVGLGTSSPDAHLDVEASASPEIRLTDTGANTWRLLNDSAGFGVELAGAVSRAVNVDVDGNMEIQGILTQGSSRDLKTGFAALDARETLDRVAALPVSLWSYKTESPSVRHVGPMAEDFHRAFGLGADARHIAPSDQAGVALLALQGLHQVVREEVEEKDRKIAELTARLAALEKLVQGLAGNLAGSHASRGHTELAASPATAVISDPASAYQGQASEVPK